MLDYGRARQRQIYIAGLAGKRPCVPVQPNALEAAAERAMSREAATYVAGPAGGGATFRANRAAFDRRRIVPRVLRDVERRDTSITLLGHTLPAPILLAPIGVLEMAHRDADLAVARAAAAHGIPMIFSNQASVAMEACAAAMGDAPRWFQLYWSKSDELVESFVRRAERCGCEAIVLTLDTTMLGWRPGDLDLAFLPFLHGKGIAQYVSDPVYRKLLDQPLEDVTEVKAPVNFHTLTAFLEMVRKYPGGLFEKLKSGHPRAAVQRFVATYSRPSLTWEHVSKLEGMTKLPVILKGILHPDDAREAIARGVDGIIVSNHGGRQIDGEVASLDMLPKIVEAVAGRIPVLFDSGIRGGADVFKAIALGAAAVLLGRPYVYGLALAGEAGVHEVISNVIAEFDLTMGLAGCRSVAEVAQARLVEA
ncbi:MAG TPA: lactate 2-monooxygenase [Gemmatimonadales bacterium]|nr:lactate 2-monooxygenase [Gemmatimonadales bacterium]